MSWNFAHDFVLMYYRSSLSVVTLRQFLYACRDVLWYGDVRPSVRPGLRPPVFRTFLLHALSWNFAHDFVLMYYRSSLSVVNLRQVLLELCPFWNLEYWKYTVFRTFLLHTLTYWVEILHMNFFTVLQIKFKCRQFASIFVGVMPLLELKLLEIHSFPHFSLICFDILSWNFAYDFVLLYYRSSLSVVNFRQFLWELCPFWNLNYWNTVFRTFSYMLWHIELKFCTWLCSNVLQIKFECHQFVSIFVGVMPLLELKILQIHSFPHFSLTCFDILSWNFAYDFVLLYYRSSSSVVNFCVSYAPFGTQNTENIQFSALFSDMLWLIELKICTWLCFTEIKINFDCRQFASIFCGSYAPFGTLNTWNTLFTFLLHALAYWAEIFHVTFFNVLQIKFECCHSVSIHFIWNLKFDVGFFNAFLLEKYSIKIAF